MPSGAKKRKALKKKKEMEESNYNPTSSSSDSTHPSRDDDDERESDGDEAGSPASQDRHSHAHPFNDGTSSSQFNDSMEGLNKDAHDMKKTAIIAKPDDEAQQIDSNNVLGLENSIHSDEFESELNGNGEKKSPLLIENTGFPPVSVEMESNESAKQEDNQPMGVSTRGPVETASWKNCCGLFEAFIGSNI